MEVCRQVLLGYERCCCVVYRVKNVGKVCWVGGSEDVLKVVKVKLLRPHQTTQIERKRKKYIGKLNPGFTNEISLWSSILYAAITHLCIN